MVIECSQVSRSGPGDRHDAAVRQVDDREALVEQPLLAHRVAVVRRDAGVGALALDRAVAREQGGRGGGGASSGGLPVC